MRRFLFALPVLAIAAFVGRADDAKNDFLTPDNWEGLMDYWKIDGSTVTGTAPAEGLMFNTFLCSKKKYKNFEMSFQIRLKDGLGNSGVQIRSKIANPKTFAVSGPQADIGETNWAGLYGELFGGMMKASDMNEVNKVLKKDDFNDYRIKCVGKHVTITINGLTSVDGDFEKMPDDGIIAFQLHAGRKNMEATFKDIKFKELD
jgi:hypothetical protein